MSIEIEVITQRKYKAGYVIKHELWNHGDDEPTLMKSAYTTDGQYIGDTKLAYHLCKVRGIEPQFASPSHSVCSIGFCDKEQKWYGWSHRAMFGFAVGSEVKQGDCAYSATDKDDFLSDMIRFWSEPGHINVHGEHTTRRKVDGVYIHWTYSDIIPNKKLRGTIGGAFQGYPESYGQGEWVAKTIEDAETMARDFAEGVS